MSNDYRMIVLRCVWDGIDQRRAEIVCETRRGVDKLLDAASKFSRPEGKTGLFVDLCDLHDFNLGRCGRDFALPMNPRVLLSVLGGSLFLA